MRNEILSKHKTNSTIDQNQYNGSVNHRVLSKEQREQAKLLRKLPSDFPIIGWESLNTKQQLREMKSSGLNKQDQWSLLNAKAPLAVLNQYNQAEDEITRTVYAKKVASALVNHAKSVFASSAQTTPGKSTNYTPLQNNAQQRKLDVLHNEYETKLSGKAGGAIGAKVIPKDTAIVTAGRGSALTNSDKHTNNPAPDLCKSRRKQRSAQLIMRFQRAIRPIKTLESVEICHYHIRIKVIVQQFGVC